MIKLKYKKIWLNYISITWSGTDNQASRELSFELPSNPYDKDFSNSPISLGEIVQLYDDKKLLFLGVVTSRERTAEIGTSSYVAKDFIHYLLRSTGSYKFKGKTAEAITKKLCMDLKISVGSLAKTGYVINKLYFDDQNFYDMIIKAYRKAKVHTGKKYMLTMSGKKLNVVTKGTSSGVMLEQGVDITNASYSDTTDNMVNLVKIYNEKKTQVGKVQNKKLVSKYGVYQSAYTKEKKVNAKKKAESMLVGITKEANVEGIGNVKAISGKSIVIHDKATGLSGKFYITSDSHTFSDGVHTMSLGLSWNNTMEEGADTA